MGRQLGSAAAEIGGESGTGDFIAEVFFAIASGKDREDGTGDFIAEVFMAMAPGHECPHDDGCVPVADPEHRTVHR